MNPLAKLSITFASFRPEKVRLCVTRAFLMGLFSFFNSTLGLISGEYSRFFVDDLFKSRVLPDLREPIAEPYESSIFIVLKCYMVILGLKIPSSKVFLALGEASMFGITFPFPGKAFECCRIVDGMLSRTVVISSELSSPSPLIPPGIPKPIDLPVGPPNREKLAFGTPQSTLEF